VRLANLGGRAVLVVAGGDGEGADDRAVDVERASGGRFGPDPQALFDDWAAFRAWASTAEATDAAGEPFAPADLGVVAIGAPVHRAAASAAWEHIAGVTVGQDLSERVVQMVGTKPQFSLGKSFPGFGPTGPWLVTPDELPDRDDLALECALDGEVMQTGRTSQMIYTVPQLVERLSAVVTLLPGDLVFTGTPAGIGNARTPKRFLRAHETLTSRIDGVGTLETRFASS